MNKANFRNWPVAVVGGGVVGCAIAREFTLSGTKVLLLEKGGDILSGASKANSALFHTSYDVKRETLEFQCISRGREEYLRVMDELNLPMLKTSAVMVARDQAQMKNVYELYENSRHNGITDVEILTKPQLLEVVPWVRTNVSGGLRNYGEDVIDPWSTTLAYATQAIANGAVIKRNCEVLDGSLSDGYWYLETNQGQFRAETVINSAGLFGDLVKRIRGDSDFTIKPRKGQFVVFDKTASSIVDTILLPVPDERAKGILRAHSRNFSAFNFRR